MHQSKLIQIIRLFSSDEIKRAEKFLASPYFNTSAQSLQFFQYIKKCFPLFKQPRLKKERTYARLFPGKSYSDEHMRMIMSRLTKLMEEFLTAQELKKSDDISNQLLLKRYSQKDAYRTFEHETQKRINSIKKKPVRDTGFYMELLRLNHELFFHPDTTKIGAGAASIAEVMNSLDQFYALSKLKYASELFTRSRMLSEDHSIKLLDEVIEVSKNDLAKSNALVDLYAIVVELKRDGLEESLYNACIQLFISSADLMAHFDKSMLLGTLINLAFTGINSGNGRYMQQVVKLYQFAIEHDLMLHKGKISYDTFVNVAVMGAAANEFEWTLRFINEFQVFLNHEYKESAVHMAWANWYYQSGLAEGKTHHYQKALIEIEHLSDLNDSLKLRMRSLLLRIYYDFQLKYKRDEIILLDHLQAFERYLSRSQFMSESKKESYANLIRITKKLVRLKGPQIYDREKNRELKNEIQSTQRLVLRLWLLKRAEELG